MEAARWPAWCCQSTEARAASVRACQWSSAAAATCANSRTGRAASSIEDSATRDSAHDAGPTGGRAPTRGNPSCRRTARRHPPADARRHAPADAGPHARADACPNTRADARRDTARADACPHTRTDARRDTTPADACPHTRAEPPSGRGARRDSARA